MFIQQVDVNERILRTINYFYALYQNIVENNYLHLTMTRWRLALEWQYHDKTIQLYYHK